MSINPAVPEKQTAMAYAMQWAELPPEHLRIALEALEPQLAREHVLEMLKLQQAETQARRTFILYLSGLVAGFVLAVGMLAGAVAVGLEGQAWLAALLAGPSMLVLVTLFVLRKSEVSQLKQLNQAGGTQLQEAQ